MGILGKVEKLGGRWWDSHSVEWQKQETEHPFYVNVEKFLD